MIDDFIIFQFDLKLVTNLLTDQLPPLVDIQFQWVRSGRPVAAAEQRHAAIPPHCRHLRRQIVMFGNLLNSMGY